MKVLVCGGRDFDDLEFLERSLDTLKITSMVEGGATGADNLASTYAWNKGIPCTTVTAHWATEGKKAGILRNIRMLKEERPELVAAFPGGRGTAHMVQISKEAGIPVIEFRDE